MSVTVTTAAGTSATGPGDEFTYFLPAPVFSLNGKAGVGHVPVLMSGGWSVASPALGEVRCEVQLYGEVWNEKVGSETRGVAEEDGLSSSGCTGPELLEPLEQAGQGKVSVSLSAEAPLEEQLVEAEVCASGSEPPSQCAEKHPVSLISAHRRSLSSLPWKAELIRGEREGEPVILSGRASMPSAKRAPPTAPRMRRAPATPGKAPPPPDGPRCLSAAFA